VQLLAVSPDEDVANSAIEEGLLGVAEHLEFGTLYVGVQNVDVWQFLPLQESVDA
jgi:hypothetical protein